MPKSRFEALQDLLATDPGDAFARYGLAQEYVKRGELAQAVSAFEELHRRDPAYIATYYHLGQTYEKMARPDDARRIYREGIEAATRKGDLHARSELCEVLDLLGDA